MPTLEKIRFRSNPLVELKRLDSLPEEQREPFRELEADPDFYGLFVARPPLVMTIKTAPWQTAALFQSLAAPARVDGALAESLVDLVLDGVLEIEGDDGFVSGADALALAGIRPREAGGASSRAALFHAQELETSDPERLTLALYRYNQIPITPFWKSRFSGREAILAHVGADRGTLRRMLERDWTWSGDVDGWLSWTSTLAPSRHGGDGVAYKMYVSPHPERIRDAFEAVVRVLAAVAASFKLGDSAAGLLRPDKLVAYFAAREQLDEAAAMLRRELAGCPAQGVPFTAALDDEGLLSWGIDPPESEGVLRWLRRNSWRFWVAQHLAAAMAVAKAARTSAAVEPWRFAVTRVERLGVDVDTWTPAATLWEAA
jgi:hypothetical protein